MPFCSNCGQKLPDNANACPNCGTTVEVKQSAPQAEQAQAKVEFKQEAPQPASAIPQGADFTADYDEKDINDNKVMALLAYLSWLILIPLLVSPAKDSPFVRFHVNQGLILFIANLISVALSFVCIGFITSIICFVLMIIGIVNAVQGKAKELPIIGKFRLIK